MRPGLVGKGVSVVRGGRRLVDEVHIALRPGRVTSVVGPNGAGKSTLLKALAGELRCSEGAVILEGRCITRWPLCDHARRRAVLPQHSTPAFDLTVEAVVELGRMPHAGVSTPRRDAEIVEAALKRVGALGLRGRAYPTLSGGERQRVHLARVLAQIWSRPRDGGRYLLLDEPLSAQDLGRQHEIMGFLRTLASEGVGILVVVHDLNLAARYSDELVMMRQGVSVAGGSPAEVLTREGIRNTFGVEAVVMPDPVGGTPMVIPTGPAAVPPAFDFTHTLSANPGAPS
jgi:iron complex transport system ATP-binding protein